MGYCGCGVNYQPCQGYKCSGSSASINYIVDNHDLPSYAGRFYSQSEREIFSDFKYDKVEKDYDSNAREIVESLRGPPIEAYIPRSLIIEGGGSAAPSARIPEIVRKSPDQEAIEEIKKAQREVAGNKEIVFREIRVEELILRRIMSREIRLKKKTGKDG